MPNSLPLVDSGSARAAGPPVFARIGIVGLGLIGGSIALASRRCWPEALVIGVDRNDVLEEAMVRHAVDVGADDLGMLADANLVILAAPVAQNVALVPALAEAVPGSAVITDVGSTKRDIVEASRILPERLPFVGGHPLGGAARGGIGWASPDLFQGRPWIFTPTDPGATGALDRLAAFVRALGAVPQHMSPADHDRLLAFVSHLPQLTASALLAVVGDAAGSHGLALAGRGLADTTRLASSPPNVWADICAANADEIARALDRLIQVLEELRAGLDDNAVVTRLFEQAAAWREKMPRRDQI